MTDAAIFNLVAEALECGAASLTIESGLGKHPRWDSLGHLSIMLALEKRYGMEITNDTIRRYETMRNILADYRSDAEGE